jgi:hypothetical protein
MLNPRRNLINFRLTDEEHGRLKAACSVHGARSLSEFVRETVLCLTSGGTPHASHAAAGPFPTIDQKVSDMEAAARRFSRLLGELLGCLTSEIRKGS